MGVLRCLFVVLALLLALAALPSFVLERRIEAAASFDPARVVQVSWKPRIFLYKGFLSDQECDHLIKSAKSKLQKSMVVDNESGKSVMSEIRTSSGMFLAKHQDEIVERIEERIATWTFLPEENAESIQVLRYEIGEKYDAHFDYFHDKINQVRGGHRAATVLMYLSNAKKGGETVFPNAEEWQTQPKDDTFSDCARKGLAVKPIKGDAVLFFSIDPDGVLDPHSLHASCPVIEGEKWSAPKWIHLRSYDNPEKSSSATKCSDENEQRPQLAFAAAEGESESHSEL